MLSMSIAARRLQRQGAVRIVRAMQPMLNTLPLGAVGVSSWNTMMGSGGGMTNLQDVSVIDVGNGQKAIRVYLAANTFYSDATAGRGTAMVCNLPFQVDEAVLKYDLRFVGPAGNPGGLISGLGGKLPGLSGIVSAPGRYGDYATGGQYGGSEGWSNRTMWRSNHTFMSGSNYSSEIAGYENISCVYVYGYDQQRKTTPTAYGDDLWYKQGTPPRAATFGKNTWQRVRKYIKLNTIGVADGILQDSVDGVVQYQTTTR